MESDKWSALAVSCVIIKMSDEAALLRPYIKTGAKLPYMAQPPASGHFLLWHPPLCSFVLE